MMIYKRQGTPAVIFFYPFSGQMTADCPYRVRKRNLHFILEGRGYDYRRNEGCGYKECR